MCDPFRVDPEGLHVPRAALRLPWAVEFDPVGVSAPHLLAEPGQNFRTLDQDPDSRTSIAVSNCSHCARLGYRGTG